MALTPEEEAELAELEKQVSPEFLKAVPAGASVTPAPKNSLGVTGVINQPAATEAAGEDTEVGRIAAALDPRFDLIPQGLALLPATNAPDPQLQAAQAGTYKGGSQGKVKYAYEPPVSVVRKQLLENPNMLRLLRSDPPPAEEIAAMDESHPLYQDAANYMWARTMEDADKGGYQVYRYSKMPWGQENDLPGGMSTLGLKLGGMMQPIQDIKDAFVLGFDDTATLGAARAIQETAFGEQKLNAPPGVDVMGVDENVPQKTAEVNEWTAEGSPLAYGAGQVLGAVVGAPRKIYQMIMGGGDDLARAAAKTRLGDLAARAPSAVKGAAGLAGEVGAGAAEAAITQAGQELVDAGAAAAQGREPVLGAGERIMDTGQSAALWELGGGLLTRGAGFGANTIRRSPRIGQGAVGRTENNLSWGPSSVVFGPGLRGETKELVKQAGDLGMRPENAGDLIAEKIAPPIRQAAAARTRAAEGAQQAQRANYHESELGRELTPLTGLQTAAVEKLRAHHQPQPGGGIRAVDDGYKDAQKVFRRHVESVSLDPVEGAMKLTPDEAGAFLSPQQRREILADDIGKARGKDLSKRADEADLGTELGSVNRAKASPGYQSFLKSARDSLRERARHTNALDRGELRELLGQARRSGQITAQEGARFERALMSTREGVSIEDVRRNMLPSQAAREHGRGLAAEIDRKAYLQTVDPKKRAAVDDEIQASIEDRLQQTQKGDRALDIDQRTAEYKTIEQQVLREHVDEDMVLEPFGGSFADYLKQRGKDSVYVTAAGADAKRLDTIVEGIKDPKLLAAAKHDRAQLIYDGKRGGYAELRDKQAADIEKAKAVEESIAPKGDAFRSVAQQARKPQPGDKQEADVISGLADEAGVRGELDRLRSLQEALGTQHLSHGRTMTGKSRGVFDTNAWIDRGALRAFPVLRALSPGGALDAGGLSRAALLGQIEDEKARAAEVERARPGYEKRAAGVEKERADKRAKEKKERERRRTEKHRDD